MLGMLLIEQDKSLFEKRLSNQLIKNGIPKGINTIKSGNTILKH